MILSMTGFGKSTAEMNNKKVTVEIKSLNSKQLDLSSRISSLYKEKEMDYRSMVAKQLERGKVDLNIHVETVSSETSTRINQAVVEGYIGQMREIADNLNMEHSPEWLSAVLRLPETLKTETQEIDPADHNTIAEVLSIALSNLTEFRRQEGQGLYNLFKEKIQNIAQLLKDVEPYEKERTERIKTRISDALSKIEGFDFDQNRFEQEMIFYIEKLDINEEKHRLANHLDYFIETMDGPAGQGKKLGFISQEIGREINTLGSKSNHAELQKIVVRMKDELEQIKEQVLNVL